MCAHRRLASIDPPVSSMIRLAYGLLAAVALIASDGIDAAQSGNNAVPAAFGEIQFSGAVLVPAGIHASADAQSVAALPSGRIVRRGKGDPESHGPPRTVVVLPPREAGMRVVVITYE